MRLACPMLLLLAALTAWAGPVLPLAQAESIYLQALDEREGQAEVPLPAVARKDQPALQWLAAAATQALPANPFAKGSRAWQEAERMRSVLQDPQGRWAARLKGGQLRLAGSYLAFWRWGQARVRRGEMDKAGRLVWEDRLMEGGAPQLVRDYALRHALCFGLAEADAERFGRLKERLADVLPDFFVQFQNAFALLGAPAPVMHVWRLPGMESVNVSLAQLGSPRIRMEADPGNGLPELPAATVWLVPTRDGSQPLESTYLEGASLEEARRLVPRLEAAGRTAYLAPVRSEFETYALMYFPLQIELDPEGTITRIRMGDAALAKP